MRKSLVSLTVLSAALMLSAPLSAQAGNKDRIIVGSVLGAATGAVIGNSLGGRDGAIVGGAIGAATGVAIATDQRGYRDNGYNRYQSNDHNRRDDRYDRADRHDRRDRHDYGYREVETPRYYYQGNDFVYGVPQRQEYRHDRGHHRGWQRHNQGQQIIVIQSESRYRDDEGRYCPPPRRW